MRWIRSLHVQLFLWAIMPVTFVLIAFSFTGVYSHQQTMRDFVVERDAAMADLLASVAEDGLAQGVVGGDGSGLPQWMALQERDVFGMVSILDADGTVLVHSDPDRIGTNATKVAGMTQALSRRKGFAIVRETGKPVLVSFAPVRSTLWTVVIREPVQELIGPLLRFPRLVPVIALGAGLLSCSILFFGWWTIVQPLQQLSRAAEAVSWGEYDSIDRPVRGVQEVRDLYLTLRDMVRRIRGYEAGVRDYLSAVTQGQEIERTRLARELHDGTVQDLIVLGQRAEMAQRWVERGESDRARQVLAELRHTEQNTVRELRRIISALRPIYLEDLGFVPALDMLVRQHADLTNAELRLETSEPVCRLPTEVELAAYRIAQEALRNAIEHAQAMHIDIRVQCQPDMLRLIVSDDGVGFVLPDQPRDLTQEGHFGLLGMQERAAQLGGMLHVDTAPGQGTRVTAHLITPPAPD
jgi:signal transduction histidine kinase